MILVVVPILLICGSSAFAATAYLRLRPNSDVTKGWQRSTGSDNYALVNGQTINDATYVYSSFDDFYDVYGLADPPCEHSGTITGVRVYVRAKSVNAGDAVRTSITVVSTTSTVGTHTLTTAFADYNATLTTCPSGSWSWDKIDSMQVRITNHGGDSQTVYVSRVSVEVIYTLLDGDQTLRPNADTATKDYNTCTEVTSGDCAIGHYKVVDEAVLAVGDYVSTYGVDVEQEIYDIENGTSAGKINAVTIVAYPYTAYWGIWPVAGFITLYANGWGNEQDALLLRWGYVSETFYLNPADSEPWEWSDITDLEIGVETDQIDSSSFGGIMQIYAVIEYSKRRILIQ